MINAKNDYERAYGRQFDKLELDRLVVTLQVWNLNQHLTGAEGNKPMQIGVYFDDIDVTFNRMDAGTTSTVDGAPVSAKKKAEIESRWLLSGMSGEGSSKE